MDDDTWTIGRVLSLLSLLQTRRVWSGSELANRLNVTARTVRRDIERLRKLGYDVQSTKGPAGGYVLPSTEPLPPLLFSPEEVVIISAGLRVAAGKGIADGETTAATALAKLERHLPGDLRAQVSAFSAHVTPEEALMSEFSAETLVAVVSACDELEILKIEYIDSKSRNSTREIVPLAVVPAGNSWFVISWDRGRSDWRTFRMDRIQSVASSGRVWDGERPDADLVNGLVAKVRNNFRKPEFHVTLTMAVDEWKKVAGGWADNATPSGEGATCWTVTATSPAELLGKVAWIPHGVKFSVDGDAEIVERMQSLAANIAKKE